ncbi:GntR family transcriptional regulator [Methylocella sp. CPCC 101449]|uniref:GntR family transcriptional regulator n=1 Tax=Methylocella sp. CPCC 101449 TaxID=2987531 RepID=UPI00288D1BCC|nr:GntR family transcriptional regulator [Methylocella sp. CPCC 101449]MDT2021920.1 GntR family transcriptional regulator [Methylocella sp. CPCC 101449]
MPMDANSTADVMVAPISRRSLHEELAARLRDMIVEGALPAGRKVPERELCERFGVSRTPLREALKVLASEGLISLNQNRGATVAALTRADLEEVFPIMGALEALSGSLACARMSDAEIEAVAKLHDQMVESFKAGDRPTYFKLNQAIHRAILVGSGNETLVATHQMLAGRIHRARYMANDDSDRWRAAIAEHELILAALQNRDGPRLAVILSDHLRNKLASVMRHFSGE